MSQVAFPPEIPIGDWFEAGNAWLKANFGIVFDAIGAFVRWAVEVLSGFFMEPAAGQLAFIAALLIAAPLVRSAKRLPLAIIVGVVSLLYILHMQFELGNTIINSMPPFLFLWAVNLFDAGVVDAYFCISLLFLIAVTVLGALHKSTRIRTAVISGGWLVAVLLGWLVLPMVVTTPMSLLTILLLSQIGRAHV